MKRTSLPLQRREFIAGLGGAVAWSFTARAQKTSTPVIGFLNGGAEGPRRGYVAAFRRGLTERGYIEGRNVESVYKWVEGKYERLPAFATELVKRRVAVIVASGNAAARAAQSATTTIPIVFVNGSDPVELGLVSSLSRPSGNITGISFLGQGLIAKRLELLHQIAPEASSIGLLVNRTNPTADAEISEAESAANALGVRLMVLNASTSGEIDTALAPPVRQRIGAFLTTTDLLFSAQGAKLAALAITAMLPAVYHEPDIVHAGGLLSYGSNISDAYRLAGDYVGRVLRGDQPTDLPVQQAVRVELLINLKTAKALRLEIPPSVLVRADEVIE